MDRLDRRAACAVSSLFVCSVLLAQEPERAPAKSPLTAAEVVAKLNESHYQIWVDGARAFGAVYAAREDGEQIGAVGANFGVTGDGAPELTFELAGRSKDWKMLENALWTVFSRALLKHHVEDQATAEWNEAKQRYELLAIRPRKGVQNSIRNVSADFALTFEYEMFDDMGSDEFRYMSRQEGGRHLVEKMQWHRVSMTTTGMGEQTVDYEVTYGREDGVRFLRTLHIDCKREESGKDPIQRRYDLDLTKVILKKADDAGAAPAAAAKGTARWDALSQEVIPKLLAANLDGAALARHARKFQCSIDLSISAQGGAPSNATLSYGWEDADDNGLVTADEVQAETTYVANAAIRRFLPAVRKAVIAQTTAGPLNLFRGTTAQTVKFADGYKVKVTGGKRTADDPGAVVTYLTVAGDLRVTRLRIVDEGTGDERSIDMRHEKLGDQWAVVGYTQRSSGADGSQSTESCRITYDTRGKFPILQRMLLGSSIATATGVVDFRQDYVLRDVRIEWRDRPLPAFDAGDDAALFKARGKAGDDDEKLFKK